MWALALQIIGAPSDIFKTLAAQPRKCNSKRSEEFQAFYVSLEGDRDLHRACIWFRLTVCAVSICSKKVRADGPPPTLMQLGRKRVQTETTSLLVELVPLLQHDAGLDLDATVASLLSTQAQIYMRFDEYQQFPGKLWTFTEKYNSGPHDAACQAFLHAPASSLDAGYSLPLQRGAWGRGSFAAALAFLQSQGVQDELARVFEESDATSMGVERKHHSDKRSQQRAKVMSVARASRNSVLQAFRTWRTRLGSRATAQGRGRRRRC
ncbi:unnamed protein product [Prorocentrum cordatum]|uniref:Uncharacterized protein n=1 Tax=Prorocentrum cordatum TaxID=2364126 RepID=A0ABN9Q3W4_9DINO|nr:unnamed protein product [Polarella glacialis]